MKGFSIMGSISDKLQGKAMQAMGLLPEVLQNKITEHSTAGHCYAELDPHLKMILAARDLKGYKGLITEDYVQSRKDFEKVTRTVAAKQTVVAKVEDFYIAGDENHDIKVRHYTPKKNAHSTQPLPLLIFIHGGGFVVGNLETVDEPCRMLCHFGDMHVLSVDYRLSPEHKAPAAIEDCISVLRWAYANATLLGIDVNKIGLGGDSAGGHLTAMVCQRVRDTAYSPAAQLLIYPTTDFLNKYPSHQLFEKGLFLSRQDMDYAKVFYLGMDNLRERAAAFSPILNDMRKQPPALLITAAFDVLRDEGEAYAQKLLDNGNSCVTQRIAGLGHGFINLTAINKASYLATAQMAHDFRMLLDDKLV